MLKIIAHKDFMDWLTDPRNAKPLRKKAIAAISQMMEIGHPTATRTITTGPNRLWSQSSLGGHGKQFGLFWAPQETMSRLSGTPLPSENIYVRTVMHHDDTERKTINPDINGTWHEVTSTTLSRISKKEGTTPHHLKGRWEK